MVQRDPSRTRTGNAPGETDEAAAQRDLRLILANVADVVFEVDQDNTYRWVSPSVQQVLGWNPDQLEGKSEADLVHSEDLPELLQRGSIPRRGWETRP